MFTYIQYCTFIPVVMLLNYLPMVEKLGLCLFFWRFSPDKYGVLKVSNSLYFSPKLNAFALFVTFMLYPDSPGGDVTVAGIKTLEDFLSTHLQSRRIST